MHVQDDLNLYILCMLEGIFSHDVAHIINVPLVNVSDLIHIFPTVFCFFYCQADQLGLSLLTIEQLQSEDMQKKMEQRMQYV